MAPKSSERFSTKAKALEQHCVQALCKTMEIPEVCQGLRDGRVMLLQGSLLPLELMREKHRLLR